MITIRGKKHTFNMDVVGKMDFKEFEKHCSELLIFIQLPKKERNAKIKECYGKYFGNVKQVQKSKSESDIHNNDVKSDRGDIRAEQSADVGGENLKGKKDTAKIQDKKIRSENKE